MFPTNHGIPLGLLKYSVLVELREGILKAAGMTLMGSLVTAVPMTPPPLTTTVEDSPSGRMQRISPPGQRLPLQCGKLAPCRRLSGGRELTMVGATHRIQWIDGSIQEVPALRTREGTFPVGSQWTKNPIDSATHNEEELERSGWVLDTLQVPADLVSGEYVVSFR